jgi:hypothetical protein
LEKQNKVCDFREKADRKLKKELKFIDINSDTNSKQKSKSVSSSLSSSIYVPTSVAVSHQKIGTAVIASPRSASPVNR